MTDTSVYQLAIHKIIEEQELIVGPIALVQARKVAGLKITDTGETYVSGDAKDVLGHLVEQYEHLFGRASIEVCKDAIREVKPPLSQDDLPEILR